MRSSYPRFVPPFELAFHRKTGAERIFELPLGSDPSDQLPEGRQTSLVDERHLRSNRRDPA